MFGAVLHSPECGSYDNGGPADRPRGLVLGDLEADRSAAMVFYGLGFPSYPLLFVQWDFNYRFQGTVAFGMMLLALYLVLGIRNFIPRLIASLFASLLLFGLAGPVSLLFALSMMGYEAMSRTPVGIIPRFYR